MDNSEFDMEQSVNHILDDNQKQKFSIFPSNISQEIEQNMVEQKIQKSVSQIGNLSQFVKKKLMPQIEEPIKPVKKRKRQKKIKPSDHKGDYKKNICGYIVRKCIRQFTMPSFKEKVQKMCQTTGCSYQRVKNFYYGKIQRVTGPSHIPDLLVPENEEQQKIKKVFGQFALWFLKERYLRYLLTEGKMEIKEAYIWYKNQKLTQLIEDIMYSVEEEISERG